MDIRCLPLGTCIPRVYPSSHDMVMPVETPCQASFRAPYPSIPPLYGARYPIPYLCGTLTCVRPRAIVPWVSSSYRRLALKRLAYVPYAWICDTSLVWSSPIPRAFVVPSGVLHRAAACIIVSCGSSSLHRLTHHSLAYAKPPLYGARCPQNSSPIIQRVFVFTVDSLSLPRLCATPYIGHHVTFTSFTRDINEYCVYIDLTESITHVICLAQVCAHFVTLPHMLLAHSPAKHWLSSMHMARTAMVLPDPDDYYLTASITTVITRYVINNQR